MRVIVRGSLPEALKQFKKLTKGILRELKLREYYRKPSERK